MKEVCKEFKIEWTPTQNFIFQRLPSLYKFYLWAPIKRHNKIIDENRNAIAEALDPKNIIPTIIIVLEGFFGIGGV